MLPYKVLSDGERGQRGSEGHRVVDSTSSFVGKASVCECETNRFAKYNHVQKRFQCELDSINRSRANFSLSKKKKEGSTSS